MKDTRTDEELNRLIAEWMGWKNISDWSDPFANRFGLYGFSPYYQEYEPVPLFCANLDVIHEAWEKLDKYQKARTSYYTSLILNDAPHWDCENATARQRAEALVKVIEESQKEKEEGQK